MDAALVAGGVSLRQTLGSGSGTTSGSVGRLLFQSIQSGPNNSEGWGERSFEQAIELIEQKRSQPQQMRSGLAGWIGNFFMLFGAPEFKGAMAI